jgi:hypothetical protein
VTISSRAGAGGFASIRKAVRSTRPPPASSATRTGLFFRTAAGKTGALTALDFERLQKIVSEVIFVSRKPESHQ